jgi:hypothetical protein
MKCLECKNDFDSKTHNQKYCSDECCRISTNKRIMEKYYEKKAIRSGKQRKCKKCSSNLSRYNTDVYCAKCIKGNQNQDKQILMVIIDDIG